MALSPSPVVQAIIQGSRARGIDPQAALAVARQEGLSGGVGDSGHAFGPFQLNDAGGVLTGRPGDHRAFAESPAGIGWALDRIASVARGKTGAAAVNAIVRQFERPADPSGEVARALASYGGGAGGPTTTLSGGGASGLNPGLSSGPAATFGNPLMLRALMQARAAVGLDAPSPALQQILTQRAPQPLPQPQSQAQGQAPVVPGTRGGGIAELLQEGTGGPTHSTGPHLHFASTSARALLAALAEAQRLGVRAAENPYVGSVAPVHAPNSYHTRTLPGLYNGRHLGEAFDFTGPPQARQALYEWIRQNLGR